MKYFYMVCIAILRVIEVFIPFYCGYYTALSRINLCDALLLGTFDLCVSELVDHLKNKQRNC